MAFGLSANIRESKMVGGDVAVASINETTLQGFADDYFLQAKSQCSGGRGSCPDTRIRDNTNSVQILNAAIVNDYSIVTYQRPLKASDELDLPILTNKSQAIIWAIGPLNERREVSFHDVAYLKTDRFIEFGRPPAWNCPIPDQEQALPYGDASETGSSNHQLAVTTRRPQRVPATPAPAPTNDAWEIPPIQCYEPEDGIFYAQMGPTGGKRGYPAITGHVGWGISWYINGLLIPEINVIRGKKYTFVVEGGLDPETPARYHPFYITDDPVGGYQHKTPEEKAKVKIFAGVRRQRNTVRPTGVGRLCNWVPDQNQPPADQFASFGAYQRTLVLECDHGEPGIVEWTPDENTPDTVYYQCFTHRYLGWKINVHDSCDEASAASEKHEVYAIPKNQDSPKDLEYGASIAVPSKVTPPPTAEFLHQQHIHSHDEYGHRSVHHSTTNPASKLSVSHHPQLLTNANNNYDRLQSSSSENAIAPHRSHLKEAHQIDEEALQQQQQRPTVATHEQSSSHPRFTELARETQRQTTNQQLSNLVADHQRPLSHGSKLSYGVAGAQQLPYTRAPHHYANNYHHYVRHQLVPHRYHHQPEPRTQLMIIRRPVLTRRPMLQTTNMIQTAGTLSLPLPLPISLPARPVYIERKKSAYRLPSSGGNGLKTAHDKATGSGVNLPLEKLAKINTKQHAKLEAKVSEVTPIDVTENLMSSVRLLKPARNTGFDPDSIVIEGGFKPIIRNVVDRSFDVAQKRISSAASRQEEIFSKNSDYRTIDEFSPVFVPSLPMTTSSYDSSRKRKKKTSPTHFSTRLDDLDDMEMAADRLDAYYLPAVTSAKSEEPPSGILVTYDGKKLKDSSGLARSISDIEHRGKGKLTSAILSRTPQFGKFQGELPPLIPGEVSRANSSSYERRHRLSAVDLPLPSGLVPSRTSTRLTLVERSKRSALEGRTMSSVDFQRGDREHGLAENRERRERDRATISGGETRLVNPGCVALLVTITAYLAI